nr:MAG TPA: hypothetical protein [Caudoviricetes sp.]
MRNCFRTSLHCLVILINSFIWNYITIISQRAIKR